MTIAIPGYYSNLVNEHTSPQNRSQIYKLLFIKHNIIQICLYKLNSFFLDTTLATKLVSLWLNDTFNIYTGHIRPFTPFSEVQKHVAHT